MPIKSRDKEIIFRSVVRNFDPLDPGDVKEMEQWNKQISKANSVGKLTNVFINMAWDSWTFQRFVKKLRISRSLKEALLIDGYMKERRWST